MTATNFDRSLALVLVHEDGYVDHPRDPGGATNLGITIGTLGAWRNKKVTKADVKTLTRAEAAAIYRANYWDKVHGDDLPTGLDYAVFDFAVNSGMGRAIPYLQNSLGVGVDGKIGPATLDAAKKAKAASVVDDLCDRRLAYLKRLKTWPTFGKGWARRIEGVRKEALAMARATAVTPAVRPSPTLTPAPVPVPPLPDVPGVVDDEADPTSPAPVSGGLDWAAIGRAILALIFGPRKA